MVQHCFILCTVARLHLPARSPARRWHNGRHSALSAPQCKLSQILSNRLTVPESTDCVTQPDMPREPTRPSRPPIRRPRSEPGAPRAGRRHRRLRRARRAQPEGRLPCRGRRARVGRPTPTMSRRRRSSPCTGSSPASAATRPFRTWLLAITWRKAPRSAQERHPLAAADGHADRRRRDDRDTGSSRCPLTSRSQEEDLAAAQSAADVKRLIGTLPRKLRDALLLSGSGDTPTSRSARCWAFRSAP